MRAKLIYCLLPLWALGVIGCSARNASYSITDHSAANKSLAFHEESRRYSESVAGFDEGVALVAELRYDQAAAKLLPVIEALDAAGDENRAAEATFWVAYCHEKQGENDMAVVFYDRVVRDYPLTSAARQAKERLSRLRE